MSRSRWISEIAWNANLGHVLFKSLPEEYHREEKTSSRAPTGQWCYVSGRPVTCRLLSLVTCRHRLFSALCASLFVTRSLRNRGGHERGDTLLLVRDISKKFRFQTLCKLRIFTNSKYSTMLLVSSIIVGSMNYCDLSLLCNGICMYIPVILCTLDTYIRHYERPYVVLRFFLLTSLLAVKGLVTRAFRLFSCLFSVS